MTSIQASIEHNAKEARFSKPDTIQEALEDMASPTIIERHKWAILAMILGQMIMHQGGSKYLNEPIDFDQP